MTRPGYKIDEHTRYIILELISKAQALDLGNISFFYYQGQEFNLVENNPGWLLAVNQPREKIRDIYRIIDGTFDYIRTEIW